MAKPGLLTVTDAPQIFDRQTTRRLYATVIISLLPAALWGVAVFGPWAGLVLSLAILSATATEWLIVRALKRPWLFDGQVVLVGLLIGMALPPGIAWYVPVLAAVFAIGAIKWPLGGTGSAWLHPAAAAWLFALLSWPVAMGSYLVPQLFAVSHEALAGPAAVVRLWLEQNPQGGLGPGDILAASNYVSSAMGNRLTDQLNQWLGPLGAAMPAGYVDAFLGFGPGAIGQVSSLLLLCGSVLLIARRVIAWQLPAAFFGSFALLTYVFGGLVFGTGLLSGDVLYYLLRGSFLLVLFFVATDIATSPLNLRGQILAGLVCGLVSFLLSLVGRGADVALVAVMVVNLVVGLIDRKTRVRRTRLRRAV